MRNPLSNPAVPRRGEAKRDTKETRIHVVLELDGLVQGIGESSTRIDTPLPFLNHMLEAFACHGRFALSVRAEGDIEVDPHHLVEDSGLVLGRALADALRSSPPVDRAGHFRFPMDGSLADVALDLCGRPLLVWRVPLEGAPLGAPPGAVAPELFRDFFKALADGSSAVIHADVPYGDNDHHVLEALFKAFGRALAQAVRPAGSNRPLSTKGVIDDVPNIP